MTEQDRQKFERALNGGSAVLEKAGDFGEVFGRLGLNEDAEAIVAQVDGTNTASEVASASGRDAFNVYKLLHALITLGILTAKPQVKPEHSPDDDFASAGLADASDMWKEPAVSEPQFQFDEAGASGPTLEIPSATFDFDETAALPPVATPTRSAWDEPEEEPEPVVPPAPVSKMPAWEPPRPAAAPPPIPMPVTPAAVTEQQWGFDEAQLETARRAAEPAKTPAAKSGRPVPKGKIKEGSNRLGFLIALMVVFILAAGGYFGFLWWQKRQEAAEPIAVARKTAPPPATNTAQPETGTIVEAPVTATETTATTATAPTATTTVTTTQPPAPAPLTITPPAPVATTATTSPEALPVVKPKTGAGRARYDEMARLYATNPQGNFTVQIQILCDPGNLEKALRAGGENVWFVPQPLGDRACYRVFWGRFNTREEAQRAMANVPADLRDRSSAVKPIPRG